MKNQRIEWKVMAFSQCEEIEGNKILASFDTELKALKFKLSAQEQYINVGVKKFINGMTVDEYLTYL